MPSLVRLGEKTRDLGVTMACVTREDREVVKKFLERRAVDVPIYLLRGEVPQCFASHGLPTTFVLDRKGVVALRHVGAAAWDGDSVVAFVRGLAVTPAS
jgi:hypothetical protein